MWDVVCALHFDRLIVLGHKCSDEGCRELARWTTYWPGQTRHKCTQHRDAWVRVARIMGLDLISRSLEVNLPDDASQRFAMMELT